MKLIGCVRLGRDAELRYTGQGTAVAGLAGVYEYGKKGDDGKKPSQWVDLSLWGKQAEALAQYCLKGVVLEVTADEVHVETYQGKNGAGAKLVGKVISIAFAPSQPRTDDNQRQAPRQTAKEKCEQTSASMGDFDDGIPFAQFERGMI